MIPEFSASRSSVYRSTIIRPIGAYAIHGITFFDNSLLAIDAIRGYLLRLDLNSHGAAILNSNHVSDFLGTTGLAGAADQTLWFTQDNSVFFCQLDDLNPQHFVTLPYPANGVTVLQSTVYITCEKAGYILVFSRTTGRQITRFYAPGIGPENITVRDETLWVCDRTEQTVYCLDRATGEIQFSLLTPFENPTGLAFLPNRQGEETLYVAYAGEEAYIRDNPNADITHELTFRDRTFIHPLQFRYFPEKHYALSNGYLIEMSYVEELAPLDSFQFEDLEWRIALPAETPRQKLKQIEPIGLPFQEEVQDGQRVAVFKFDSLQPNERHLFGWRALLEVYSIKYRLPPREVESVPSLSAEFQRRYLVDDDELAMDTPIIRKAAQDAIGTETNLLRKMFKIRNYVYDRLSYGIKPRIDTPDVVLERGVGSCGEYLGVLLALARLNGIACRTVGRYKCPADADRLGSPLQPDFNHVWMEFYIPGLGWVPMESNPDDIAERGPYPARFFMGLSWYHMEVGKGIPFEALRLQGKPVNREDVAMGDLAINHVRFTILEEISPAAQLS